MEIKNENNKICLFKEGTLLIFKKWTGFRMALDYNPQVLSYYANDDHTELELNSMIDLLINDIYTCMENDKAKGQVLENKVADYLAGFVEDYFGIELEDSSDLYVAKMLIRLYEDLSSGSDEYLGKVKENDNKFLSTYSIEFPIIQGDIKITSNEFVEKMQIDSDQQSDNESDEPDEDGFVIAKNGKAKFGNSGKGK